MDDCTLKDLQRQVARQQQLRAMVEELRRQLRELSEAEKRLQTILEQEEGDVDRLEGATLSALFYAIAGRKEEKLDQERLEALAARVKWETARREREGVEQELARREAELQRLSGCKEAYAQGLEEKRDALKRAGGEAAAEILALEQRLAAQEARRQELEEAAAAGQAALSTAQELLRQLASAEGWSTFDLLGGGVIAGLAKHSHLDEAQETAHQLQQQLHRFQAELADVRLEAEISVRIDGFLRFADYFFDGLLADWAVAHRIDQSQQQAQETEGQIQQLLAFLHAQLEQAAEEAKRLRESLDQVAAASPFPQ